MRSSKRPDHEPKIHHVEAPARFHRLDVASLNHSVLSDCCGAPIMQGGICFECRERCEEELADTGSAGLDRTSGGHQARTAFADDETPCLSFREEDGSSVFDGRVVAAAADHRLGQKAG